MRNCRPHALQNQTAMWQSSALCWLMALTRALLTPRHGLHQWRTQGGTLLAAAPAFALPTRRRSKLAAARIKAHLMQVLLHLCSKQRGRTGCTAHRRPSGRARCRPPAASSNHSTLAQPRPAPAAGRSLLDRQAALARVV